MKSKTKLIISIFCVAVILIIGCVMTIVCYRPYSFKNVVEINVGINGSEYVLKESDSLFTEVKKTIKQTLNSSTKSIFWINEQLKMPCDDETVESYKSYYSMWIEIVTEQDKYSKLFFVLKETPEQFITIFVTKKETYSGGKFLFYNNCDCKKLLDLFKVYFY